jgi:hypothetical protein
MTLEDISPSTPSFSRTKARSRATQGKEEYDCYQSFGISNSPPRLSKKRKSCHNDCLAIPTKLLKLRPDFFIPDLSEIDSKDNERKVQSTEFKLNPRRRMILSPPRLCRKDKTSAKHHLVIPTKVLEPCPAFSVPDLYEIDSKKEERKTRLTEFKLYPRQRTTQSRLKALMNNINNCIL